jgi:hypothetical protein
MVPWEQMAAYVSAQVDAMRWFSVSTGRARDHWGFAWAPRNTTGLSTAEFGAQTGQILDRMAAAIRDSGDVADPESLVTGACGADATLCSVDLPEARHNEAWRSFRTWAQSTLAIGPATPLAAVAGIATGPLELSLASAVTRPATVTLRSSSPAGTFSTSSAGPWASTLTLSVAPGVPSPFFYLDTRAGTATLTATAPGISQASRGVAVAAGPTARIAVTPASREVRARGEVAFTAAATDAFGNPTATTLAWSVSPAELGTIVRARGGVATFRAGRVLGSGTVTARRGALAASAAVTVRPAALRVAASMRSTARGVRVTLTALDGRQRPVSRATLAVTVRLDGRRVERARVVTGAGGKARIDVPAGRGCYSVVVTRAQAQGFVWNGRSPRSRTCR